MTGLPQGDSPFLLNSSYTITADIEVPEGGAEGMILTSGGRFAGYGFYLLKGKPVFLWNLVDLKRIKWEGPDALTPGKHTVEFDFKYDGLGLGTLAFNNMSGLGRRGTGTLKVDGKEVATQKMEHTLPMILQWDESFDIGSDTLTGVNDADYQPPFTLTAKLNKLTIKIDRPKLTPEDDQEARRRRSGTTGRASSGIGGGSCAATRQLQRETCAIRHCPLPRFFRTPESTASPRGIQFRERHQRTQRATGSDSRGRCRRVFALDAR